jgi:two-component system sensor histidine kinase KdpD
MPEPLRPDPDRLLAQTARAARGRLKVFLGAAPGVGKTFEMLAEARRRQDGGADILAGIIETHGRPETALQQGALPLLPRAARQHRGQTLEEFDLDAALARRPQILLLDELAHSNAPGSRHPKRWQDVEELRDAGIEVWTTMNVQHLESLSDAVARITGVQVAETVPDHVLAGADAVELIDIPPTELLERLRQGKVYRPDQADRALRGFFREGNLAALREMALRRTAERVGEDVTDYMRSHAIVGPWPAGDRVLALVGGDAGAEGVVRAARRVADALKAPLLALHVERPGGGGQGDPGPALQLAQRLGAGLESVIATDLPSTILAEARRHNATHLVLGRGRPALWRRLTGRSLSAILLRRAGDFSLYLVPNPGARAPAVRPPRGPLPAWLPWLVVPGMVLAATALGLGAAEVVPEDAMGMVYLAVVVLAAVGFGPLPGLLGALLSFLAWNYTFLPPRFTLAIAGPQDLLGAAVFTLVAVVLASTTGGLGHSMRRARARMLGLRRLVEFSRRLGAPGDAADLPGIVAQEAAHTAGCAAAVLMPLPPAPGETAPEPVLRAAAPVEAEPDATAMAAARWAMAHGRATGCGTDTLPGGTPWQFRPMRGTEGVVGLLALRLGDLAAPLQPDTDRTLEAMLEQAAIAIERGALMRDRARDDARAETEELRLALLTSLGHDLRTPLTSIRGAIATLRQPGDRLSAATRADLLETAEEEAVRLSRYIANILDIVRIENGQVLPQAQPLDLADAINTAADRVGRQSGRAILRDIPARLPEPKLDPMLLDQILGNLLENAVKFSGAQGRVTIGARREGYEVAIVVEDDGPGIPAADLPHVFDPFFRVSRRDRVVSGTGLGLAICRGLAQAMGGRIAAESPPGGGARLTLRFPA